VLRGLGRLRRLVGTPPLSPHTQAWLGFHEMHGDTWVGPTLEREIDISAEAQGGALLLEGDSNPQALPQPLTIEVSLGPGIRERIELGAASAFSRRLPLGALPPGRHTLVMRANVFMVPHDQWGNGDYRPLSYRLTNCALEPAGERGR
jgi:hypothetical protein